MSPLTRVGFFALLLGAACARADVSLAPLFTDRAVLQREKPVPIWGRATPGEKITLTFAGQTRTATAAKDGRWEAVLDPLTTSSVGAELTVSGRNILVLRDVVVGEVWLCSGQSNMAWPVQRAANSRAEIAAAQFPLVRQIEIAHTVAAQPAETVRTSGWLPATSEHVGSFSAVGYFFARDLHRRLNVPIGLVHCSWGGTPIESWLSEPALASNPAFAVVAERWQNSVRDFPANKAAYDVAAAAWTAAETSAKAQGPAAHANFLAQRPRPRAPRGPGDSWTPAGLFNGMVAPLVPFALRGFLWYQGESNAERAAEYQVLFATLITAWRTHFGQGDVPFYWVNLANYAVPDDQSGRSYAFLREAQTKTLTLPNTGQALAIDVGDPNDIHPTNKLTVGRRLALLAKNRIYDVITDDTGPTFASVTPEGATMRVKFTHVASGLIAHDTLPRALELAGADRVFHPATGRIERDTLVVTSPAVKKPEAVRYAWQNAPEANLFNGAGLPAVPFRSDNW